MNNNKDKKHKEKIESDECLSKTENLKPTTYRNNKKKNKHDQELKLKTEDINDIFLEDLEKITKDLIYISETDADIFPFVGGFAEEVNSENLFSQVKIDSHSDFKETKFEDFFRHPIRIQDWFDEERKAQARQYLSLKKLLADNLTDIKVFKVGSINLDIYIVGHNEESKLVGIKTKATET